MPRPESVYCLALAGKWSARLFNRRRPGGAGANTGGAGANTSGAGANTSGAGANTSGAGANTGGAGANPGGAGANTSGAGANIGGAGANIGGAGANTSGAGAKAKTPLRVGKCAAPTRANALQHATRNVCHWLPALDAGRVFKQAAVPLSPRSVPRPSAFRTQFLRPARARGSQRPP